MAGRFADNSKGDFENAPVGTHIARCFKLIDIGTQHGNFEGKPTKNDQFIAFFELPFAKMNDGQPFIVTRFYNKTLGKKAALRKDLESWRGKPFTDEEAKKFDLMKIMGLPCMVSVIAKTGGDGIKVGAVFALPAGTAILPQINPSFAFWIAEWDQQKFDSLSDGIKVLIAKSDEYIARFTGATNGSSHKAETPAQAGVPF